MKLSMQREYREEIRGQSIVNVYAIRLHFQCLQTAKPEVQIEFLQMWKALLSGHMANLAACERYRNFLNDFMSFGVIGPSSC